MSTKGVADIVFCLDASDSMTPCFQGVSEHIVDFVAALQSGGPNQGTWDLRLDFVAHQASKTGQGSVLYPMSSVRRAGCEVIDDLYAPQPDSRNFFTSSLDEFREALRGVETKGDEDPLLALDVALDFPWRDAKACHRVVVLMTDEPVGGGLGKGRTGRIPDLIQKIQALRVMVFLVTPSCPSFEKLSEVDRCEHYVVGQGGGLADVDFKDILSYIGKSVSVSTGQGEAKRADRALFGQDRFVSGSGEVTGR